MTSPNPETPPHDLSKQHDFYVVRDIEQARVLADPLRLRLLRAFASVPKTTKQVSKELGEKPTRLYRHVDALKDAGLIRVTDERRKRGTVERYLQAVSRRFAVDPGLFAMDSSDPEWDVFRTIFETTRHEASRVVADAGRSAGSAFEPLIARFGGVANAAQYAALRARILAVLSDCATLEAGEQADAVGFSGLFVLYATPSSETEAG